MQPERFDLNDIQHEPTDEQLDALMASVSTEARRRAEAARRELMVRVRAEIEAVNYDNRGICMNEKRNTRFL